MDSGKHRNDHLNLIEIVKLVTLLLYCTGLLTYCKKSPYYLNMKNLWINTILSCILSILSAQAADLWLSERIAILGSFAGFQYSLNAGIAWGIRLPAGIQEVLIIIALVIVAHMAIKSRNESRITNVGFGFIVGGGLANVIDRIIDGYVTDYVQIGSFPIFNVADSFVCIGVVFLLYDIQNT